MVGGGEVLKGFAVLRYGVGKTYGAIQNFYPAAETGAVRKSLKIKGRFLKEGIRLRLDNRVLF